MGNNCLGRSVADEPIFMPEDAERLQHGVWLMGWHGMVYVYLELRIYISD